MTETRKYVNEMGIEELARWYCLIKGIRAVFDKLEDMEEDVEKSLKNKRFFNRVERCINAYIEESLPTVISDIEIDHQKLVDTFDNDEEEL